jgi:DNA-binding CsgD family transcriptional regulator/tetratricopeptide (TPR) repeat protein
VAGVQRFPLVGREAELRDVRRLVGDLGRARGAVMVVLGDAGIGKTTLVREVIEEGRAGGAVAYSGAAHPFERTRPFGALADALCLNRRSSEPARAAISRLLRGEAARTEVPATPVDLRYRIVEEVVDLVEGECKQHAVILAIDDVHWADASTLLALRAIMHRLAAERFLLVVSLRQTPRSVELDQLLDEAIAAEAHVVRVGPLSPDEVEDLARHELGRPCGPKLATALARAGGNPLWAREILSALADESAHGNADESIDKLVAELPDSLRELVVRRLRYLPDPTLKMLQFTAVLGDTASVRDLATITRRPGSEVVADLAEAFRSGVVGEAGDAIVFRHQLVHDAIYQEMPRPVRQALHRDAASALAESGADVVQVAGHLTLGAARGDTEAVTWLRQAAHESAPTSPPVAVELLARAESLLPAGHDDADLVSAELVGALLRAGQVDEAAGRAEAVLDRTHRAEVDVPLRLLLVSALSMQNRSAELIDRAEAALAEIPDLSPGSQALVLAQASIGLQLSGRIVAAEHTALRALRIAEDAGEIEMIVWSLTTLAKAVSRQGRYAEALGLTGRAVDLATEPAARLRHPRYFHAMALADADRFAEATAAYHAVLDEYEQLASPRFLGDTMVMAATAQFLIGDLDAARDGLIEGLRTAESQGLRLLAAPANAHLATIALAEGDNRRADQILTPFATELTSDDPCFFAESVAVAAASLAEAVGDEPRALELLRRFWIRDVDLANRYFHRELAPPLVRLALARGEAEFAREVADLVEAGATSAPEVPTVQSTALRCRGLVDGNADLLLDAVALARDGGRVLDITGTCEDAAAALVAAGRPEEAKVLLLEAVERYETMGALAWAGRVQAALRAVGVRRGVRGPRQRPTHGWVSLTASERRVSELVAEGLTNKEVATRLHVSPHTVNTHLRHLFAKLGVSNRAALATEVARRAPSAS